MDADVAEAKRRLVEVIRAVESGEEIVRGASALDSQNFVSLLPWIALLC